MVSIRPAPPPPPHPHLKVTKQFSGSEYYTDMVLPILNMVNKMTRVSHSSVILGNGEYKTWPHQAVLWFRILHWYGPAYIKHGE